MGKINVLDFRIANLIAAGEVVERPASAAKELMENAVDAGATDITLEIKRGGIAFMRVSDNGCGMSREDLPVCVQRHATSKIREAHDLDAITTLGFRGEALAAISSVCDMRIMTRRREDSLGTMMSCSYGKITDLSEVGCAAGTTIVLENMFANVPARRKFLKKDASESMAVAAIAERVAISNPHISVKLIIDGTLRFKTPGNSQALDAIHAVFGREFSGRLNFVQGMNEGIEINGYIGRPDNVRANRNYQLFFINGRYVRSKTATAALEQAFDSFLESEKFPCCVLYITLHPSFVDVNVHPTKLEVKFSNERAVFDAIYCAVRNTLMESTQRAEIQLEPETMKPEDRSLYNAFVPVYDRVEGAEPKNVTQQKIFDLPITAQDILEADVAPNIEQKVSGEGESIPDLPKFVPSQRPVEAVAKIDEVPVENSFLPTFDFSKFDVAKSQNEAPGEPKKEESKVEQTKEENGSEYLFSLSSISDKQAGKVTEVTPFNVLGIAFNAYIVAEFEDKIWLIDKHAAHERILFEDMKKIMAKQEGDSQILMLEVNCSLSPEESVAAQDYMSEIKSLGFDYTVNGGAASIYQIPAQLSVGEATDMFSEMVARLTDSTGSVNSMRASYFEKALYQASCKAAMKAGRSDDIGHQKWLVERILAIPDIKYCPHGRPVLFELTKSNIEKYFKRL